MSHPNFPNLYDFALGIDELDPRIGSHVEQCGLCQMAVASLQGESTTASWHAKPPAAENEELPPLAPGQFWRLEWLGETGHVLVISVEEAVVEVLPVVEDPELIEGTLIYWSTEDSPLGFAAAVWSGPRVTVPSFLFDRYYGHVELSTLPEADGRSPTPYSPAVAALIGSVISRLESLSAADWVPTADGDNWDSALMSAKVSYADLAAALGLSNAELEELTTGTRLPSDEERSVIADLLRRDPVHLPGAATIPLELVLAMNRPAVRPDIRRFASERRIDEETARQSLARDFVTAAHRTAKAGSAREFWERVVDDYFRR